MYFHSIQRNLETGITFHTASLSDCHLKVRSRPSPAETFLIDKLLHPNGVYQKRFWKYWGDLRIFKVSEIYSQFHLWIRCLFRSHLHLTMWVVRTKRSAGKTLCSHCNPFAPFLRKRGKATWKSWIIHIDLFFWHVNPIHDFPCEASKHQERKNIPRAKFTNYMMVR